MNYVVIVKKMIMGKVWNKIQKEFADQESAESYAKTMYDSYDPRKDGEISVTVYELIKSYN